MRRGVRLEAVTVAWNAVEALVGAVVGIATGSVAMTGFGLDSGIEIVAAGLVLTRLRRAMKSREVNDAREKLALRGIAVTFIALAVYLFIDGSINLAGHLHPKSSWAGIAVSATALVVMPALAVAKRRTAKAIGSALLLSEAAESMLCAWMAFAVLAAITIDRTTGQAWVDPVAGFVIAGFALREAHEAWQGEPDED